MQTLCAPAWSKLLYAESLPMLLLPRPPLLLLLLPLPGPSPYLPPACSLTTEHWHILMQMLHSLLGRGWLQQRLQSRQQQQQQQQLNTAAGGHKSSSNAAAGSLGKSSAGPAAAWGTGLQVSG